VTSTEDSPVKYNALDPDLQLWVAACLYKGGVDVRRIFIGEMDDETADQHYRDSMALGTMLQMRPEMWPADRPAFDKYWEEQLENIHIDDTIREFLYPIAVARLRGLAAAGTAAEHQRERRAADHHRVPAAAVSRGDEAGLEFDQAARVRRVDDRGPPGQQHRPVVREEFPVQCASA
jgi:uncharacterized protein (DUF2236 family)